MHLDRCLRLHHFAVVLYLGGLELLFLFLCPGKLVLGVAETILQLLDLCRSHPQHLLVLLILFGFVVRSEDFPTGALPKRTLLVPRVRAFRVVLLQYLRHVSLLSLQHFSLNLN